jgi:hypothetical protein
MTAPSEMAAFHSAMLMLYQFDLNRLNMFKSSFVPKLAPKSSTRTGGLDSLRTRRERPRDRRAAEQRDELAPFQLIELHPLPLASVTA